MDWGPVSYAAPTAAEERVETATLPPARGARCAEPVVVARGNARFATWWEGRADGSAVLMLAHSPDAGVTWEAPLVADDRDAGDLRCARPQPSLFADETTEYLHVSYYLSPSGSPGVYFTHSMKASALGPTGEGVLHMPVAVTYGERPVRSSVAGRGDTVLVAYEDPNAANPRILLALSTGAGHLFTGQGAVSPSGAVARDPRISLRGDSVFVRWDEEIPGGGTRFAARAGRLR